MNTLNFDTLTSGDILLTTTRSGVEGYYFFGEDKNLWSVKAVENGDNPTATVVPLGLPSSDEYILTLTTSARSHCHHGRRENHYPHLH